MLFGRTRNLPLKTKGRGQNDPLRFFWNNSRKEKDFSTKFWLLLDYDIKQ